MSLNKISTKIKRKLDNINNLKTKLLSWRDLSEEETFKLIKEFEKTPRDEGSSFYHEVFTDSKFAQVLLDISVKYKLNTKMNVYIISSLGNMMSRYKLKETKNIYEYFLGNLHEKGLSVYVSLFFTDLKYFVNYPDKWSYVMSIKDMKPKKIGESSFQTIVLNKKDELPVEYKKNVAEFFRDKVKIANSEGGKNYYLELVEEFSN
ncbi:hypothetical protein CXF68_13295 [Tenacibaculum sp. Bg11-29]|uniref:hypothetical protein n=1 Tax=Tenacibaculum sp. Bg11-29 TaxID=2058306 RepID=UPI000C33F4E6|nr:hypothetical protein [Tenacibaculum sp. Bg11-29]PKH51597.1 hypothetical protein CXF68_13295 [Tenacibaculum sp. Bg11-29]